MDISDLFEHDDHNDHLDSSDHWFSVSGQSIRVAYRMRMSSWILRILLGHGGMPRFMGAGHPNYKPLADLLDVPELMTPACTAETIALRLHQKAEEILAPLSTEQPGMAVGSSVEFAERVANWPVAPCCMANTLNWLSQTAGLGHVEHAIFELAVSMRVFQALKLATQTWGVINRGDLPHALSAILNIPMVEVREALHSKGPLLTSGILRLYPGGDERLQSLLFVSRQLAEGIAYHSGPAHEILEHMAVPLQSGSLQMSDFAHIPHHNKLARSWLEGVLEAAAKGQTAGHMLVGGDPGLGKTGWCRALLAESSVQALELVATNPMGAALSGEDRLHNLRMVMQMQRATPRGVILFDEADDVFRPPGTERLLGRASGGDADAVSMDNHRAALNHMLESSRIPVIWIMNRPEVLDMAVLRRFDVEIHFEEIPRSVRLGLINKRFSTRTKQASAHVQPEWADGIEPVELERWAEIKKLTPALIDRLALVRGRSKDAKSPMDAELCRHWLKQRIPGKATQHLRVPMTQGDVTEEQVWSPDQVNTNVDLMELVAGIQRVGSARLALSGPPGTGKTAFAKALARMLDKPLLEKRASDLLSAYVGETEQRIREAFEEALAEDAVFFIDEVDGLLANRDMAVRNWEVTQVNELLENLGEYTGVLAVATNRMDAIDPAALRRIDMQIHFEALRPQQVREGFAALCKTQAIEVDDGALEHAGNLDGVTPGDFAAISRRLRFAPGARTAAVLITLLQELLDQKQPKRMSIGFTAGNASDEGPCV